VSAPRRPARALARWAAEACPLGARVLEVGAGDHASGGLEPLLRRRPYLVGVDPAPSLERNVILDERHQQRVEDFAPDHPGEFDVVVSVFVLEHVDRPADFVRACATVLRPGGSWFALTLNTRHYFGATTWAATRLGIEEWALHALKGEALDQEHHFPTAYRCNSWRAVRRYCDAAGFEAVDFRYYEATEHYSWYFPSRLAWIPGQYARAVAALGRPGLAGHLSFQARKPDAS